jgi:hypothetical protein
MPRLYTITFEGVAVSAPQDLVTLLLPTSAANFKQIDVVRWWLGATDTTLPTAQMLQTRCRWLPATVTAGSGGSTPTPTVWDQGDSAAKCTAHANDTSKSTTNGTAVIIDEQGFHIYNGYDSAVAGRPAFPCPNNSTSAQAFVFELLSTVSGTVHLSGGIDFAESA